MRLRIYGALLLMLAGAFAAGVFAGRYLSQRQVQRSIRVAPANLESALAERLAERLDLTAEQKAAIRDPLRRMGADFEMQAREHRRATTRRVAQMLKEIRPHLDPPRQTILDSMTPDDLRPRAARRQPHHRDGRPPHQRDGLRRRNQPANDTPHPIPDNPKTAPDGNRVGRKSLVRGSVLCRDGRL